jgi:hypothetical protein
VAAPYPRRILSRESGRTLAVFAVAAVVLLGSLGGYGLWDPDEGRHAAIARELFAATTWQGWLLPSHNFEPYYDKPILYYWLTSLAYGGIGVNEAGARLVSAWPRSRRCSRVPLDGGRRRRRDRPARRAGPGDVARVRVASGGTAP